MLIDVLEYLEIKGIGYDCFTDDYILVIEDDRTGESVSLETLGKLYDWFIEKYDLKIEFYPGLEYGFKIYRNGE
jgi:hypothetical protein